MPIHYLGKPLDPGNPPVKMNEADRKSRVRNSLMGIEKSNLAILTELHTLNRQMNQFLDAGQDDPGFDPDGDEF